MLTFLVSKDESVPRPDDALLTISTTSDIIEASERFTYSLVEKGELEMVKTGRYNKITLSSINAYITRLKSAAREKLEAAADAEPPRRGRIMISA